MGKDKENSPFSKKDLKQLMPGCLFYLTMFATASYLISQAEFKKDRPEIEEGYVNPEKVEIQEKDLYKQNNHSEALMNYEGNSYVLKLDKNGNPFAESYDGSLSSGDYVNPNKLEILSGDKNDIPGKETVLRYHKEAYSLKKDSEGKPKIENYEHDSKDGPIWVPVPTPVPI